MCSRNGEIHWLSYKALVEQRLGSKIAGRATNGQSRPTSRNRPGTVLLNRQAAPIRCCVQLYRSRSTTGSRTRAVETQEGACHAVTRVGRPVGHNLLPSPPTATSFPTTTQIALLFRLFRLITLKDFPLRRLGNSLKNLPLSTGC